MAKKQVRYQVLKTVFVNGSLVDPKATKVGGPVYVMADEGLEGTALKLAPERAPEKVGGETGGDKPDEGSARPEGS